MNNIRIIKRCVLIGIGLFFTSASFATLVKIDHYKTRFPLTNPYDKLVDNRGVGDPGLYGVRNFRAVLSGIVYRGGANNVYHHTPRANSNPLQDDGIENLCKEGFSGAVYLYSTNYETAPKTVNCNSPWSRNHTFNYVQESVLSDHSSAGRILEMVYEKINSANPEPIYLHCWNGWHASGYISALILRQFCGYSAEQAVLYWNRNTDGVNVGSNYDRVRARIRSFVPSQDMMITPAQASKICL